MAIDLNKCNGCHTLCVWPPASSRTHPPPWFAKTSICVAAKCLDPHRTAITRRPVRDNIPPATRSRYSSPPTFFPAGAVPSSARTRPAAVWFRPAATSPSAEGLNDITLQKPLHRHRYCSNNWSRTKWPLSNCLLFSRIGYSATQVVAEIRSQPALRGVMEQCTYCVQFRNQQRSHRIEKVTPRSATVRSSQACEQGLPDRSLIFVNANDKESRRSPKLKRSKRITLLALASSRTDFVGRAPRISLRVAPPNPALESA